MEDVRKFLEGWKWLYNDGDEWWGGGREWHQLNGLVQLDYSCDCT